MKKIKFNFKKQIIQDKEGNQIDLSKIKTIEDLKNAIIYKIEFPYCKNCGFYQMCPYKRNTSEETCMLLDKAIRRYIDMNIKSIDYNNSYYLEEFIKSCYYFVHMSNDFLNFLGIYTDDDWNKYFESRHSNINSLFSHKILVNLSKYIESNRMVKTDRIKKFIILVEGKSDKIIISSILKSLGTLGIDFDIKNSIRIVTIEGKSKLNKQESIKDYFERFKELETDYFLFVDEDAKIEVNKLISKNIVKKNQVYYFKKELEEEYPLKELILYLEDICPDVKGLFKSSTIKTQLKRKRLKDIFKEIANQNSKTFDINKNGIKTKLAEIFSKEISNELEKSIIDSSGCQRGDWIPKSKRYNRLVERVRPLANKINKISTNFYV
jgi:hypothetical protein